MFINAEYAVRNGFKTMKPTNEKCNAWECEHNIDGYCESAEALTKCNEELLKCISKLKEIERKKSRELERK